MHLVCFERSVLDGLDSSFVASLAGAIARSITPQDVHAYPGSDFGTYRDGIFQGTVAGRRVRAEVELRFQGGQPHHWVTECAA